jgi:hypothetical protein
MVRSFKRVNIDADHTKCLKHYKLLTNSFIPKVGYFQWINSSIALLYCYDCVEEANAINNRRVVVVGMEAV